MLRCCIVAMRTQVQGNVNSASNAFHITSAVGRSERAANVAEWHGCHSREVRHQQAPRVKLSDFAGTKASPHRNHLGRLTPTYGQRQFPAR